MTEIDKTVLRTVPEVAKEFNLSKSTIYRYTNSGEIEHTTLHGRTVLTIQAAEDWIRANRPNHINSMFPAVSGSPITDLSTDDAAITIKEAASLVQIKEWFIYRAIYDKDIVPVRTKIPAKVSRNDIIAWAASYTGPIRHSIGPKDHTRSLAMSRTRAPAPTPAPTPKSVTESQPTVASDNAVDVVAGTIDKLVTEVLKLRSDNATLRAGNTRLVASLQRADEALTRRE